MTTSDKYMKVLQDAKTELDNLMEQQEDIERKIARLRQLIISLVPLTETPMEDESKRFIADLFSVGITDAIREILKSANAPISPLEIKQQLINRKQDLSEQKNVMASIHSTLKRLVASSEIDSKDKGLTYYWISRSITRGLTADAVLKSSLGQTSVSHAHSSGMRGDEKPPLSGYYKPKK